MSSTRFETSWTLDGGNMLSTRAKLLESPRTLLYICGLAGMQTGLFQVIARHGLGEQYMTVKPELASEPPAQWTTEQIKRYVRPTRRCMLEVY